MDKFKFIKGKNFAELPKTSGVYLFYEKQDISPIRTGQVLERLYGEPVYNGMTIYYILKGDTGKYKYLKYKSKYLQLKNQNI